MKQGKTNMGRIEELEAILNKPLVRNNAKEMMRAAIEAIALAKRVGDDDLLAFAEEIKNEIKTMAARHAERLKTRMEKGLPSFNSRIKARHKSHVRMLAAKPAEKVEFAGLSNQVFTAKELGNAIRIRLAPENANYQEKQIAVLKKQLAKTTSRTEKAEIEKQIEIQRRLQNHNLESLDNYRALLKRLQSQPKYNAIDTRGRLISHPKYNNSHYGFNRSSQPAEKVEFAPISGRTGVNDREKMVVIDQAIKASGISEMDIKQTYPDIRQSIERIRKNPGFYSLRDAESVAYKIKQLKAMSSRPGVKAKFATPEQIKERYKQLRAMPKQRLFDIWTRETLGRIHNADIKEQDKLNMAVDLIRSEYERKDWEAAGFKISSSRPGVKIESARPPRKTVSSIAVTEAEYLDITAGEKLLADLNRDEVTHVKSPHLIEVLRRGRLARDRAWKRHDSWHDKWEAATTDAERARIEAQTERAESGMRRYKIQKPRFARPGAKANMNAYSGLMYQGLLKQEQKAIATAQSIINNPEKFLQNADVYENAIEEMEWLWENSQTGNSKKGNQAISILQKAAKAQLESSRPGAKVK
jgi:hypothetical protein